MRTKWPESVKRGWFGCCGTSPLNCVCTSKPEQEKYSKPEQENYLKYSKPEWEKYLKYSKPKQEKKSKY